MACYKRILYIDYYEDGIKRANVGFVKLIQWKKKDSVSEGDSVCFQIYVTNLLSEEEMQGEIKLVNDVRQVLLGQVKMIAGKGMSEIQGLEEMLMSTGFADGYSDILLRVVLANDRYFECMLQAGRRSGENEGPLEAAETTDKIKMGEPEVMPVKVSEVHMPETEEMRESEERMPEERMENKVNAAEERAPIHADVPGTISGRPCQVRRDKWQQLWECFSHIRPFEDEREYLKIELCDMVVLSNLYYRLVENSFLLHGYYNYGHLILMKMHKRGKERIYIGVPGNFYEKEKQVAVMFGFESFEPKAEPAEEADFGYYLIGVEI